VCYNGTSTVQVGKMQVKLKSITPDAEVNIVEIARVSSPRTDKKEKPEGLINYLIKNKHWSPFQHSYLTFEIETSKAIGIQLLRHLSFTFQEFSQRYAKVEKIEDIEFRLQAEKNRQSSTDVVGEVRRNGDSELFFVNFPNDVPDIKLVHWLNDVADYLENGLNLYSKGLELGIAKECARMILPMATSTKIYMTGSVRSWIHFLDIRDEGHAQKEIQLIAREIKKIFCQELPIISKALGYVKQDCSKVVDELIDAINKSDIHWIDPMTGEKKQVTASKKET
jgi:thymidylate synthase (FAD)